MNETTASERTYAVTERVGEALGAREGTGPDDDPLLRSQRRQGFDGGRVRGHAEGRAELMRQILLSRGIGLSEGFLATVASAFAEWPGDDRVVATALACENDADFLARLRSPERLRHGTGTCGSDIIRPPFAVWPTAARRNASISVTPVSSTERTLPPLRARGIHRSSNSDRAIGGGHLTAVNLAMTAALDDTRLHRLGDPRVHAGAFPARSTTGRWRRPPRVPPLHRCAQAGEGGLREGTFVARSCFVCLRNPCLPTQGHSAGQSVEWMLGPIPLRREGDDGRYERPECAASKGSSI